MQTALVTPLSAFVSNTATVAVFLPVILSICRDRRFSPSRFLIPLSFASLLGGMCTVIGTSTNIVVSSLLPEYGIEPMRMFEFLPIGLVVAALGFVYLSTVGPKFVPARRTPESLTEDYHLRRYITEVEILPESKLAGLTLEQSKLSELYDLDVLEVHRGATRFIPTETTMLYEGDVLMVRATLNTIRRIEPSEGLRLKVETKVDMAELHSGGMLLAEAVVPPGSSLDNRSLQQMGFRNQYGVTALAIYHHREYIGERVGRLPLRIGDVLLLYGSRTRLRQLAAYPELLSVVTVHPARARKKRAVLSIAILLLTVLAATSGMVSLVQAAVAGATLTVLSGCLTLRETYRAVDRRTIFLLAGMISLGLAMQRTGAAGFVADGITSRAGEMGPLALLAATYLCTAILTELITNNACAVVMTPIAIAAAAQFGYDPRPYAFAVAYAASASFLTPFGYQTNLFVYGPGGYQFTDFARIGVPLSLMCWIVAMGLIPRIWPLVP
jgi:di/tricarboxylate transporter